MLIKGSSRYEEDCFKNYAATIVLQVAKIDFFFFIQVAKERKMKYSAHHDPIHDQVPATTF